MKKAFLSLVAALLLASAPAQNALQNKQRLRVATYQYADNPRIKNLEPFAQHLEALTQVPVQVVSYATVQELLHAMERQEVDVAFMNTFGYLMLIEKTSAYRASVVLQIPPEKENAYKSVMVMGAHQREKTLEAAVASAENLALVLVSEGSTSGNLIPRLKLASLQPGYPERFFLEVQYTGNHRQALERALSGEAALCAFGSNEYYGLGVDTVRMKKVWESPAIPLGPVVYKKDLPEYLQDQLEDILLNLHMQNAEALESIKAGWTEAIPADRYIKISPGYYDGLLNLSHNPEVSMQIIRKFAKQ